jgi:hypothetical protein
MMRKHSSYRLLKHQKMHQTSALFDILVCHPTPVHYDGLPTYIIRSPTGQKQCCTLKILRSAPPAGGNALHYLTGTDWIGNQPRVHLTTTMFQEGIHFVWNSTGSSTSVAMYPGAILDDMGDIPVNINTFRTPFI